MENQNNIVFNIRYTKPEAEKGCSNFQYATWQVERSFYDLTAGYNYVSYSLSGHKTQVHKDYLDYMEKSTGAFGLDGELSQKDLNKIKTDLAKTKSIIWHGYISFDEETSKMFQDEASAQDFIHKTFSSLFKKSHLDINNINLLASLHKDTEHRHIHFEFWEKEPKFINSNKEITFHDKGNFNKKSIDNFLITANMYLKDNKYDFHHHRDLSLALEKDLLRNTVSEDKENKLKIDLLLLAGRLPKTSRLSYNSANMADLRPDIDAIVNKLMNVSNPFKEQVLNVYKEIEIRKEQVKEIARLNSVAFDKNMKNRPDFLTDKDMQNLKKIVIEHIAESEAMKYAEKLKKDFTARLGNLVIGYAKMIKENGELITTGKNIIPEMVDSDKHKRIVARKLREFNNKQFKTFLNELTRPVYNVKPIQQDFTQDKAYQEYLMEQAQKEWENEIRKEI